jgi:hypothetical protein
MLRGQLHSVSVAMAEGRHPVPSRTRKLSPLAPMVLPGRPGGRVGRRRDSSEAPPDPGGAFACAHIDELLRVETGRVGNAAGRLPARGCCAPAIKPARAPMAVPRDAHDRHPPVGHRALPARHLLHEMFQSATPSVQELGFLGEPTTVTTSPGRTSLKNHWAASVDMLTQPWETLARPWDPTDQGAAWTNSPLLEIRTDQATCW